MRRSLSPACGEAEPVCVGDELLYDMVTEQRFKNIKTA
jgi:hypothetical protein